MSINFPNNPSLDQTYISGDRTWRWNGRFWQAISTTIGFTGSQGTNGTIGVDGFTGSQGDVGTTGFTGSRGTDGTSVVLKGSVADLTALNAISTPTLGDLYVVLADGDGYVWNGSSWDNAGQIQGPAGAQGMQGNVGFVGSQGTNGTIGVDGYTGSQGTQGDVGFVGSQGIQGDTGYTGSQGTQGDVGFVGSQGIQGDTGFVGSQGIQGDVGFVGSQGIQGDVGFVGSQGNTGLGFRIAKSYASVAVLEADTSPTGIVAGEFAIIETDVEDAENSRLYLWSGSTYTYVTDLSGQQGITGPQGNTGFTGSSGASTFFYGNTAPLTQNLGDRWFDTDESILYIYVNDGSSEFWLDISGGGGGLIGYTGSQGDIGTTGFTGSRGTDGTIGVDGYTGSQGDLGYTGSEGESSFTWGNTSPISPSIGDRWYNTTESILLVYVDDGDSLQWVEVSATGFLGQTGYTGSTGQDGAPGAGGVDGAQGFTGSSGAPGAAGQDGAQGFTGSSGAAGLSGVLVQAVTYVGQATAADPQGGETLGIVGAGFNSGITVYVDSTECAATLVDSSNLTFVSPAKGAGIYDIVVYNTDGSSGTRPQGIEYSGAPVWTTQPSLPEQTVDAAVSIILSATSNSAVTYFLQQGSAMPAGLSLSSAGTITGTVTGIEEDTEYTFTVVAIDAESQTTPRSFSLTVLSGVTVEYLVVAGGGGSGFSQTSDPAGGGGAGGYRSSVSGESSGGGASAEPTLTLITDTSYTVTVGAGGAGGTSPNGQFAGGDSVFGTITSLGGGGGGNGSGSNSATTYNGRPGGSGGGGAYSHPNTGSGGAGTSGQGYAGGTFSNTQGGGGGGAGAAVTASITGGSGINSSIAGSPVLRAVGGNGSNSSSGSSAAGTANTGNGAKAGWNSGSAAGGSGVVILKYSNAFTLVNADGGLAFATSTAVAGYKITTFTAGTGNIVFYRNSDVREVEYLVIAGGGGGANYGGGGGGGYRTFAAGFSVTVETAHTVTVGAGGTGGTTGAANGAASVFSTISSAGGGRGGANSSPAAGAGGSGGGGNFGFVAGGAGNTPSVSPSQGNNGGAGGNSSNFLGGGGGGAGAVGGAGDGIAAGAGGNGSEASITGTAVYYAGGGGGGAFSTSAAAALGGLGGGGVGGKGGSESGIGQTNLGGGGGGAGSTSSSGSTGGSGVVIIAYPDSHAAPTAISAGLTYDQPTRAGYRVYRFTAGTGIITF